MLSAKEVLNSQTIENKLYALETIKNLKEKDFTASGIVISLTLLDGNTVLNVCLNDDVQTLLTYLENKIKEDIKSSVVYSRIKKFLKEDGLA